MKKEFSIIVGLYNHKKYLSTLIEALNQQTFKDFEVHFCDDHSNDGTKITGDIGFPYQYHRLKIKKGMRLGKSLNQGIKRAKGKYCIFIMGDSYPAPNYLEVLKQHIHPKKVLCGIRHHIDEEEDMVVDIDYRIKKMIIPPQVALLTKDVWNSFTGNGLLVPAKALKEVGGWGKVSRYGGDDTILFAKLYAKGYVFFSIPQAILFHFYHRFRYISNKQNKYVNKQLHKILS